MVSGTFHKLHGFWAGTEVALNCLRGDPLSRNLVDSVWLDEQHCCVILNADVAAVGIIVCNEVVTGALLRAVALT